MKNLRKYRKLAGLTQKQLGEKTNLTRSYINSVEQGKYTPPPKTAKRISRVLNVHWTNLYED